MWYSALLWPFVDLAIPGYSVSVSRSVEANFLGATHSGAEPVIRGKPWEKKTKPDAIKARLTKLIREAVWSSEVKKRIRAADRFCLFVFKDVRFLSPAPPFPSDRMEHLIPRVVWHSGLNELQLTTSQGVSWLLWVLHTARSRRAEVIRHSTAVCAAVKLPRRPFLYTEFFSYLFWKQRQNAEWSCRLLSLGECFPSLPVKVSVSICREAEVD